MTADKILLVITAFALLRGTFALVVVVRHTPPRRRIQTTVLGLVVTTAPDTLNANGDASERQVPKPVHHGGRHE